MSPRGIITMTGQDYDDILRTEREKERDRIIERIGQCAQEQSDEGDIEGAHLLTELVRLLTVEAEEEVIDDYTAVDDEDLAQLGREAAEDGSSRLGDPTEMFAELEIEPPDGLPPARERPDEDVMSSMIHARRMRG